MIPASRRKLIRKILILGILMIFGIAGRFLFLNQSIPSLLMGRRPGSVAAGTPLIHTLSAKDKKLSISIELPSEARSPIKVNFNLLGGWKYIEGKTPIPEKILQLDGQWIEITGFIGPNNETSLMTHFILIQSLWNCCFGQAPALNHFMDVTVAPSKVVEFYPDPVTIIGKFSVGEKREEGYLVSLYRIEAYNVVVK